MPIKPTIAIQQGMRSASKVVVGMEAQRLAITRRTWLGVLGMTCLLPGCALVPDVTHKPQFHNPFPQLYRVAIVPFYNQSREPTLDGDSVAIAYYNELQAIPGFEVMPVGVARKHMEAVGREPQSGADFQMLARSMGVDAVIVGAVTEYSPYYPPRMAMSVDWYAANPGFHPIPTGYGLPWGTPEEEYIPEKLVDQAEFALAREQLATQTPDLPDNAAGIRLSAGTQFEPSPAKSVTEELAAPAGAPLPATWPDPRGFVPLPPRENRPPLLPQTRPVISYTKIYDGKDADFTAQLESYFYQQDDARFNGWKGYLQRPDDFVRFCCRLHVTETLAARGGAGKSRAIVRWPIGRYER